MGPLVTQPLGCWTERADADGFDRYWDIEIDPEDYSYVGSALRHGYSILTYDRLGTGNSTKADAYEVLQAGV